MSSPLEIGRSSQCALKITEVMGKGHSDYANVYHYSRIRFNVIEMIPDDDNKLETDMEMVGKGSYSQKGDRARIQ